MKPLTSFVYAVLAGAAIATVFGQLVGMAVGLAFALAAGGDGFAGAVALALGIG